jgi:hypothetical protein
MQATVTALPRHILLAITLAPSCCAPHKRVPVLVTANLPQRGLVSKVTYLTSVLAEAIVMTGASGIAACAATASKAGFHRQIALREK